MMSQRLADSSQPAPAASRSIRCAHCGLESRGQFTETWALSSPVSNVESEDSPNYFCCRGCMGAYALIHELGLENFYSLRSLSDHEAEPVLRNRASEVLKDLSESGVCVENLPDGTCQVRLGVEGLHCAACAWLIESLPPSIPGLKSAKVRLSDRSLVLHYDPSRIEPFRIADYLSKFGYVLGPLHREDLEEQSDRRLRQEHWFWIAVAFFLAANAMWVAICLYAGESTGIAPEHERFLRWIGALLGLLSAVFPGRIFFRSAWQSIKTRIPHVDVPVALGLLVGTVGSIVGAASDRGHVYFDSLASLVLLLRIGRYIQFRAQFRSGMSIAKLLRFYDIEAVRLSDTGDKLTVPAKRLKPGDRVEVRAGSVVPADGVISKGQTQLQTAFITGESRPRRFGIGDQVIGGSLNLQSMIEVTVLESVEQGRLGKISALVQQATADRTFLMQLADKVGRAFVWVVLGLAVCTCISWWVLQGLSVSIERTVSLLTIACPCALALAAPLVITVAIGRAAKEKIWIRDGNTLERLSKPGVVCLDKTGTLTFGDLRVIDWDGPSELLPAIAAIEAESQHPIAKALIDFYQTQYHKQGNQSYEPCDHAEDVRLELGRGITGRVRGREYFIGRQDSQLQSTCEFDLLDGLRRLVVKLDGELQGTFKLGDVLRPGLIESLKALQDRGWKLVILSGDDYPAVRQTARWLESEGIRLDDFKGGLSPEQKKDHLLGLRDAGFTTVMIGDGINDAVALASADVGIAVRGPSEIALKNAPIYIGENHLESIPRLFDASKNAVKAIHRCFAASLLYNCITIGLAISGYIHPLIAAIFMPISGITVLVMAWTARTFPPRKQELP
jgi:Cu2+-exporting ATPase